MCVLLSQCRFWRVTPSQWRSSLFLLGPFQCISKGSSVGSLFYYIALCSHLYARTILGWVLQIWILCNQRMWIQSCCLVFITLLWLFIVSRNFTISFSISAQKTIRNLTVECIDLLEIIIILTFYLPIHEHISCLHFFLPLISFANLLYFKADCIPACLNLSLTILPRLMLSQMVLLLTWP